MVGVRLRREEVFMSGVHADVGGVQDQIGLEERKHVLSEGCVYTA